MEKIFVKYLNKFLNLYFFAYPKQFVPDLYRFYSQIVDILNVDIKAKYPHVEVCSYTEDDLFNLLQLDPNMEAVFLHRLERSIFLKEPEHPLLPFLATLMKLKTGIELYYSTEIGPGLNIQHGFGIVIGPRCTIGNNFVVHQGVTIGHKKLYSPDETIIIGNEVVAFAGAKILGNVRIGDRAQIGANAVLITDAEADSLYVGAPAKKIKTLEQVL